MQTLYHAKITGDYAKHNSCILRFKKYLLNIKIKLNLEHFTLKCKAVPVLDYFLPHLYMTCAVPIPKLWSAHFKAYSPTKESPVTSSTDARKTMVNGVKLLSVTHKSRATLFDKHCAIMLEVRKGILVCSVSEALSGGWMQVHCSEFSDWTQYTCVVGRWHQQLQQLVDRRGTSVRTNELIVDV